MKTSIDFFTGEWAFLSNFYPSSIRYEGITYPTVEHAFQAQKTFDKAERQRIADASSPARAKRLGKQVKLRKDWESVKVRLMTEMVRLKFAQADLRELLLTTGDAELVEGNTWNDRFWGVCGGAGKNWLGRILVQVREEIKDAENPAAQTS